MGFNEQIGFPEVKGVCPSCGGTTLFLGSNGFVTCSVIGCKNPGAATDALKGPEPKLVAYKLTRHDCPGWMFCGTHPGEVGECLKNELDQHEFMKADEISEIKIEAFEITQTEIDNMPEFEGW